MQGTHECIIQHVQTLKVNGGDLATLTKRIHMRKSLKVPLRHICVYRNTACTQRIMYMTIFIAGSVQPLIFCYKIASVT